MAEPTDLEAMIVALRDRVEQAPRRVDTTRRRVMASLEARASSGRRRVTMIAIALTLGTGTLSWAATTGRLAPVLARLGLASPQPTAIAPRPSVIERVARPHGAPRLIARAVPAPVPVPDPVSVSDPDPVSVADSDPVAVPAPAPPPRIARPHLRVAHVDDADLRFRRAHALHFHSNDPAAALAAWDDYLTAYPSGSLAVEARYNRALTLVRLRRWADARTALTPFSTGDVTPAGYRQADATALIEAIDHHLQRAISERAP